MNCDRSRCKHGPDDVQRYARLAAILLFVAMPVSAQDESTGPPRAEASQDESRLPDLSELNRHLLFNYYSRMLQDAHEANDVAQIRHWLDELRPAEGEEDLRGFSWRYYHRLSHQGRKLDHGGRCSGIAFSPDGETFATVGSEVIKIWDTASSQVMTQLDHDGATHIAYSPDGTQLISWSRWGRDGLLKIWSLESHELLSQFEGAFRARYSNDGTTLAIVAGIEVHLIDTQTLHLKRSLKGHMDRIHDVAFSSDGKRIATGGHDQCAKVWDADDGTMIAEFTNSRGRVEAVAFVDDDRHLILDEFLYGVRMFDIESGEEIERFRERARLNDYNTGFALSPDRKTLALASEYVGVSRVDFWDIPSGQRAKQVVAEKGESIYVTWFANGNQVAVARHGDRTIQIWNTPDWSLTHTFLIDGPERGLYGRGLDFSANGDAIALTNGHSVLFFDLSIRDVVAGQPNFKFSADGDELFAAHDSSVKIYDVATGNVKRQIETFHDSEVGRAAVAPSSGRVVGSRFRSAEIYVWDDIDDEPRAIPLHEVRPEYYRQYTDVSALAVSPSGGLVVAAGAQIPLQVYDLEDDRALFRSGIDDTPYLAAIADDGTVATVSAGTGIRLRDANTGESLGELKRHGSGLSALVFSQDGKYLASQDASQVRIWSVGEKRVVQDIELRRSSRNPSTFYRTLTFSPDSSQLFIGDSRHVMQIDVATGERLAVYSIAYWHDGDWNLQRRSGRDNEWSGSIGDVTLLSVSRDGTKIAAHYADGRVYIWNVADARGIARYRLGLQSIAMEFHPEGTQLIACGSRMMALDLADGTSRVATTPARATNLTSFGYSPDRNEFVTAVFSARRFYNQLSKMHSDVRVWDVQTGQMTGQLESRAPVAWVDLVPQSNWVLGIGSMFAQDRQVNQLTLWDGKTGGDMKTLDGAVRPFALSPDGRRVAYGNRTVRIATLPDLNLERELKHDTEISTLAFAPEGSNQTWLATAGNDRLIRIIDYTTGEVVTRLVGHVRAVTSVAFSPDGRTLASGSLDDTLRIWDLATLTQRVELTLDDEIKHVAFSPDGTAIAVGLADGKIRLLRGSSD